MSVVVGFHMSADWRWQRVLELDEGGASPSRSRDDQWVRRARKYQQRKATLHVHTEARLEAAYPDIHLAWQIHDNLVTNFLWIIEAGVLAGVSQEELAKYLALTPEVIEAYEKLFFDVRDKLDARGYILGSVVGPLLSRGITSADPDGFWKVLSFNGGWEHVKGCWSAGQATEKAMTYYKNILAQQLPLKAAAATLWIQPNSFNAVDLIRAGMEQVFHDEESGKTDRGKNAGSAIHTLVKNIQVLVQNPRELLSAEEPRVRMPMAIAGPKKKLKQELADD
jgi:hypothetical protein